jgi:hypothetical protein
MSLTVDIAGNQCTVFANNKGTAAEFNEVFLFYKPIRNWVRVSFGRTEETAVAEAELVLSDPVRFGVLLMAEGTQRLRDSDAFRESVRDFVKAAQELAKHPNRGVPYGDDLPLKDAP